MINTLINNTVYIYTYIYPRNAVFLLFDKNIHYVFHKLCHSWKTPTDIHVKGSMCVSCWYARHCGRGNLHAVVFRQQHFEGDSKGSILTGCWYTNVYHGFTLFWTNVFSRAMIGQFFCRSITHMSRLGWSSFGCTLRSEGARVTGCGQRRVAISSQRWSRTV